MDIYVYFNPISRLILHLLLLLFLASSCLNTSSIVKSCMKEERQALLSFKQDLTDPSGRLSSWVGHQCCRWRGISCNNRTGHVAIIDLRNPYPCIEYIDLWTSAWYWNSTKFEESCCLGGKLNHSLLDLKHLSYLDLSNNYFKGIHIPNFIGQLTSLRYLNLSHNSFWGEVPPSLGNLSNLNYLDLSSIYPSSKNSNWLSHLSSLKYLNLRGVDLSSTGVSWLHDVNMIPSLLELHLSSCQISGNQLPLSLPTINFTSLLVLDMSFNDINSSFPKWMFNLTSLTKLDLGDNPFIRPSSKNLNWLSHLSSLNYLNLRGVDLSSIGVSWLHDVNMLPSLLELHLSSCQISGNQLPLSLPTINFTSLLVLDMSFNDINSSFPKWMFNLTSLTKLDLGGNPFIRPSLDEFVRLKSLEHLDLSSIGLKGQLFPKFFGNLCKLKSLDLPANDFDGGIEQFLSGFSNCSFNRMESLDLSSCGLVGKFPSSLRMLKSLQYLSLSDNSLNGSIPESLGKLTQLVSLNLFDNLWEGSLTEAHLINLTRLKSFSVSTDRLVPIIFNLTDYEWVPPFKLRDIYMDNCRVGAGFPLWLQSQTELVHVLLTNAGISGPIPEEWLFKISSQIKFLDLSYNQISGKLPFRFNSFPILHTIDLSHNQFDDTIPSSICSIQSLYYLALNNNQLSGEFPKEWSLWSGIYTLDVSNNNMSGNIPSLMGIPSSLSILKIDNNHFSGEIPSALQNCSGLERLYLGGNKFTGSIPSWIGSNSNVSGFIVLQLQSNSLSGHIPHHLCSLPFLQILDLSHNRFSGTIPKCLNKLTSLVYRNYSGWSGGSESEVTTVTIKGRASEYFLSNAELLTIIDFSSNDLEGEIPEEISSLVGLGTLNLSINRLSGNIPSKIGNLKLLETLDLSQNQLSGQIPNSLASLTFLSHLNLSRNNLTGRIPSGNQLQTLDDSSIYEGNPSLCGFPLSKCPEDRDKMHEPHAEDNNDHEADDEKLGLYTSVVLGFIIGFWGVCGTLILKKSWRYAYFQFFDHIREKVELLH
ncbi:putative non-specific serine/threonine protein kinase [Rosa chinensis]|uniref:Putative non-specific serine/threonine protein kinase n=1 Tax=Rosa chinensis TaxID=74649 RepID=A0A2P6Q7F2_ROSCH|nr:receptor-like protein EIX2 [Rosa chinensis]PRQ30097.1 putative non-specific serine/threonine protein kinase [Rosa chinensis]